MKNKVEVAYNKGYRVDKVGVVTGPRGKQLKTWLNENGYLGFGIKIPGRKNTVYVSVHKLQAYTKYGSGAIAPKMQTRHKNGICTDNSWDNILIGTASENNMDKDPEIRRSAAIIASRAANPRTKSQRELVYAQLMNGVPYSKIHGVSKGTLSYMVNYSMEYANFVNKKSPMPA